MEWLSPIIHTLAFALGWMLCEIGKALLGGKVDWNMSWIEAIFAGMIFAFLVILIK